MNQTVTYALFLGLFFAVLVFAPDVIAHGAQYIKANEVAKETVKLAEREGGITDSVKTEVQEKMKQLNLDPSNFTVTYSTSGKVGFDQKFTITIKGEYKYHAFNLLGTGLGNFSMPINLDKSGYGEVYFRN